MPLVRQGNDVPLSGEINGLVEISYEQLAPETLDAVVEALCTARRKQTTGPQRHHFHQRLKAL